MRITAFLPVVAAGLGLSLTGTVPHALAATTKKKTAASATKKPNAPKKSAVDAAQGKTAKEAPAAPLRFNFDVRPILANKCFKCHGQDEKQRKGKLRLDDREAAIAKQVLSPGKPEASELVKRLFSADPEEVMPPSDSHLSLAENEKALLRRWIAEGATYEPHWAFSLPTQPTPPTVQARPDFPLRSPIDAFVLAHLQHEKVEPAAPAAKERWLRRVSFDLGGLPPSLEEIDAFLADGSVVAYERVVDRLLASHHFGERLAQDWLDAARYADTYGRHEDAESPVWPYRDWVVAAFNKNLPYDQFIIQQTAGDLLPEATPDMKVATIFNRLVQQSNEAGSNEEEFRQDHIADRVQTNATTILGLTLHCCRCHDHKYDPFTMRDYYSLSAFLNNIDELGLYSRQTAAIPSPTLQLLNTEQQRKLESLKSQIAATEKALAACRAAAPARFAEYVRTKGIPTLPRPEAHYAFEPQKHKKDFPNEMGQDPTPPMARQTPEFLKGHHGYCVKLLTDNQIAFPDHGKFRRCDQFSFTFWYQPTEKQERAVLLHRTRGGLDAASRGYEIITHDGHVEFALCHFAPHNAIRIRTMAELPLNAWTHLTATYDGSSRASGLKLYWNGRLAESEVIRDSLSKDILYRAEWGDFDATKIQDNGTPTVELALGWRYNDMGVKNAAYDEFKIWDQELSAAEVLQVADGQAESSAEAWIDTYLRDTDEEYGKLLTLLHDLRRRLDDEVINNVQEVMVMKDLPIQRPTFVLHRGQWDQKGEAVSPATLAALPPMDPAWPKNRLGLAKWYVDRSNPLTSRVYVNRLWQIFFGRGLVATPEDFGIQGQLPTHPELLDWLACDFMDHGWDIKRLCREIVLSTTYRQASLTRDPHLMTDDPENRLLARGPRHRLSAEEIRDQALAVAGLLVDKVGGPPVKPYQTEGIYQSSGVQATYVQDHGESLWRRSLYTFRKRTLMHPTMTVFDGPTREFCQVRRDRTQTPLQALTLMNDVQYVEACRVTAQHLLEKKAGDPVAVVRESFRRWTSRSPTEAEAAVLAKELEEESAYFAAHPDEALAFCQKAGEAPVPPSLPPPNLAATAALERLLLSDFETLVKE